VEEEQKSEMVIANCPRRLVEVATSSLQLCRGPVGAAGICPRAVLQRD
jgi:hypothetical protein